MDIELYALLSTVILVSTIVTLVFALFSYIAFRYRQRGVYRGKAEEPKFATAPASPDRPLFFRRYEGAEY